MKKQILKITIALAMILLCGGCQNESSDKDIIQFLVGNEPWQYTEAVVTTIDKVNKTISIQIPHTWDITSLYLFHWLSDGATGSLNNHEPIDFSKPVLFKITAEDGSSVTYIITVNIVETRLISFTFEELDPPIYGVFRNDHTSSSTWVDIFIPFYRNIDLAKLTPKATVSEGSKLYHWAWVYENDGTPLYFGKFPAIGASIDFKRYNFNFRNFQVEADINEFFNTSFLVLVEIIPLSIDGISRTSAIPGDLLTLSGFFAPSDNTVRFTQGQNTWNGTVLAQSTSNITVKIPGSLPAGQYTLSVASHGETANHNARITLSIPVGRPWITGLDRDSYRIGDRLVMTGVNFPAGEIAYINFVPVRGGVTIVRNVHISGSTATLDAIPNELLLGIEYEVAIHFSGSDLFTNDYPIVIVE